MNASYNNTSGFGNTSVGFGITNQTGTNPSVLNPTSSATSTDYNVGQVWKQVRLRHLELLVQQLFNQMAFSIEKVTVTARSEHTGTETH